MVSGPAASALGIAWYGNTDVFVVGALLLGDGKARVARKDDVLGFQALLRHRGGDLTQAVHAVPARTGDAASRPGGAAASTVHTARAPRGARA